jgi:hypothetical protein
VSENTSRQESHGHELHVIVYAPRDPEPKAFTFPPSESVGQAAAQAAAEFSYVPSNFSFQTESGEVLNRDLTLAAAGVRNGDKLTLVDVGGGV